jgi:hypothetical protein
VDLPKDCNCRITEKLARWAKLGAAKAWWAWAMEQYPIDLTSLRTYTNRSAQSTMPRMLNWGKPRVSPVRAARIHGLSHLYSQAELDADREATGPIGVYLNADWGIGDAVCLTASLRDVWNAYPREYQFYMRTSYGDVFRNLPGVCMAGCITSRPDIRFRLNGPHHGDIHLVDFLRDKLSVILGRKIPAGPMRPHLVLGDDETIEPPVGGRYWVLSAGHRVDITAKAWPPAYWQAVIDALPGVKFVRTGMSGGWNVQPPLKGIAADLTDKTSIRDLIRLIAHPNCIGVIGGESSAVHIAAGFGKRMICVAGDRMLKAAVCYEDEDYLGDNGYACAGCVKYRVHPLKLANDQWPQHNQSLCVLPTSSGFSSCMEAVKPVDVVARIMA